MTTKADTSVKHFRWDSADAPALTGQSGKLIEVLDACLVNGFGVRTPDSVVVANEVATVTIGAGNPYAKDVVISISGASVPALNSEWRIDTSSASSFTFGSPGVPDGAVSGASIKRASAGWAKPFSGTNLAVYQSVAPDSLQLFFRVNDTPEMFAEARGYGQVTAVDAVGDPFPTLEQHGQTQYGIRKSQTADAVQRPWAVVADDKFFYIFIAWAHTTASHHAWNASWFGDFVPLLDGSVAHCAISLAGASSQSWPGHISSASQVMSVANQYSYRGFNPAGIAGVVQDNASPQTFSVHGPSYGNTASYPPGSVFTGVLYPHPNNRIDYCTPLFATKLAVGIDGSTVGFWGIQPGRAAPLQHGLPYTMSDNLRLPLTFNGYGDEQGKRYLSFLVGGPDSTRHGGMMIDITGPWR